MSELSPQDAAVALRSYPRRFRDAFASVDEVPDEAAEHADHVARSVALIGEALRRVVVQEDPILMPAVADDAARDWSFTGSSSLDDVLTFLELTCTEMAAEIDHVSSSAWTRTGTVAGSGQTMTAIDIVREAVRTGATHLRAAQALLG